MLHNKLIVVLITFLLPERKFSFELFRFFNFIFNKKISNKIRFFRFGRTLSVDRTRQLRWDSSLVNRKTRTTFVLSNSILLSQQTDFSFVVLRKSFPISIEKQPMVERFSIERIYYSTEFTSNSLRCLESQTDSDCQFEHFPTNLDQRKTIPTLEARLFPPKQPNVYLQGNTKFAWSFSISISTIETVFYMKVEGVSTERHPDVWIRHRLLTSCRNKVFSLFFRDFHNVDRSFIYSHFQLLDTLSNVILETKLSRDVLFFFVYQTFLCRLRDKSYRWMIAFRFDSEKSCREKRNFVNDSFSSLLFSLRNLREMPSFDRSGRMWKWKSNVSLRFDENDERRWTERNAVLVENVNLVAERKKFIRSEPFFGRFPNFVEFVFIERWNVVRRNRSDRAKFVESRFGSLAVGSGRNFDENLSTSFRRGRKRKCFSKRVERRICFHRTFSVGRFGRRTFDKNDRQHHNVHKSDETVDRLEKGNSSHFNKPIEIDLRFHEERKISRRNPEKFSDSNRRRRFQPAVR